MLEQLRITLIQTKLHWQDPWANLKMFESKFSELIKLTDLIILPEMFTTGFTMNAPDHTETMDGSTITWMQHWAKKLNCSITGSIIIEEDSKFYNRLIWIYADGRLEYYDKRHLFTMAGEDAVYTAGKGKLIVQLKNWKICPLICYDLRFPVWSRNSENYDLLIYVANWPEKRIEHWDALLKARAIENQVYVIGVNRIGKDGNGYPYVGNSAVIHPRGEILFQKNNEEISKTIKIDKKELNKTRKGLPFLKDIDQFEIVK